MPIIGKNVQNLKITHKNNKIFMFSDLFGKYVVLYFYPRDDTPGCTKEAKDFTELKPEFDKSILEKNVIECAKHYCALVETRKNSFNYYYNKKCNVNNIEFPVLEDFKEIGGRL